MIQADGELMTRRGLSCTRPEPVRLEEILHEPREVPSGTGWER